MDEERACRWASVAASLRPIADPAHDHAAAAIEHESTAATNAAPRRADTARSRRPRFGTLARAQRLAASTVAARGAISSVALLFIGRV
jgi:hypothetical protein